MGRAVSGRGCLWAELHVLERHLAVTLRRLCSVILGPAMKSCSCDGDEESQEDAAYDRV